MTSRALAVLVLALTCNGCALDRYAVDRVLDLSDVVDAKLGFGTGVGVKLEATDYAGTGLGVGTYPWVLETFGRRAEITDMSFFHVLVFGLEHAQLPPHRQAFSRNYLFVQLPDERPPPVDRFRIGFEVLLPFVSVGLSLNAGELVDLVAGLATIDLANDDGVAKGTELFPASDGRAAGERETLTWEAARTAVANAVLPAVLHQALPLGRQEQSRVPEAGAEVRRPRQQVGTRGE